MKAICLICLSLWIGGCAATSTEPKARVDTSMEAELPPYSGPKASLAVSKFEWKAEKEDIGAGDGLKDMLTTLLVQSKRFKVLERQELGSIKEEIGLSESGYVDESFTVEKGKIRGADILVIAAITGWEPGAEKRGGGVGGFGPGWLGAIGGAFKKSYLAMDIRIISSATSEVLAATRIEGEAKEVDLGILAGGIFGSVPLGGVLSKYSKTPMEKAIRVCLKEAVKYILENTPKEYFKY
ncbi:MAG: CsgG/HfaB family protein [bacterium]